MGNNDNKKKLMKKICVMRVYVVSTHGDAAL